MQDELRESHFEAVVIGTGLTQSIVAAALAAVNKPIIHIDESETYGGPHASLSLSELSAFNPTFDSSLISRQYSLSLTPQLIPATGPFIAALVNSGVSRYGSFVLPKRVVVRTQEGFKNVPANKQDVFKDKAIGLVQKRRLIKFLMFATGEFEGSSELNGKPLHTGYKMGYSSLNRQRNNPAARTPKVRFISFPSLPRVVIRVSPNALFISGFRPLVVSTPESFRSTTRSTKSTNLRFITSQIIESLYSNISVIPFLDLTFSKTDQTLPALVRTRTYLRSVGRYGPSPFLIGHYGGAGELAQGFCRTCAVGGGTYVLGRKVVSITKHEEQGQGEGKETTHRSWTTSSGKKFSSYHPPTTFETFGVEGVQIPAGDSGTQAPSEIQAGAESEAQTEGEGQSQTKDESKAQTEEIQPSAPTGSYFRVQLEGFAAPFTARMLIGSEKWLASVLDTSDSSDEPKLSNTIRAILITDAPATFAPPASDQSASSDQPVGERLDESIIIFPSEEGAVSVLVNGSSTMSCPEGKCILYFAAQSSQDPKEYFAKYVSAVLDACSPRPEVWGEVYWREREVDKIAVRHADQTQQAPPREEEKSPYSTTHLTEGPDAAAREAERVFWDALGDQPGEDGKGKDGVEFFARVQREDDLFDDD